MLTKDIIFKKQNGNADIRESSDRDLTFATLLAMYEPQPLHRGQFVSGEVVQIEHNVILADVDAKRTAVVPPQDLADVEEEVLEQLSVGDEIPLYVLRTPRGNEDLVVSLNRGLEQEDWLRAKTHLNSEQPVKLKIIGYNKGGLLVDFGSLRGFIPASHVPQLQGINNKQAILSRKAELVGQELLLNVIEVDRQRSRLILSARKAQEERRQQRLQELKQREGKSITGHITSLVSFGAFVDLNGVDGLIHISEIDWQNVNDPADYFSLGEEVKVMILSVDTDRGRVSLSRKALRPDPWEAFTTNQIPGNLVEGVVTSVTDFGAFVRVAEGVDGLLHASEIHGSEDFAPQDLLYTGDTVLVRILDIQPKRQRLALSQRQVSQKEELEWMQQKQQVESELPAIDRVF
jgi:small subunit ribosomal protein S1